MILQSSTLTRPMTEYDLVIELVFMKMRDLDNAVDHDRIKAYKWQLDQLNKKAREIDERMNKSLY